MKIRMFLNSNFRERIHFESSNSLIDVALEICIIAASSTPLDFELADLAAFFNSPEPDVFDVLLIGLDQRLWEFKILDESEKSECSDGSKSTLLSSPWTGSQVDQSRSSLQSALSSMNVTPPALPPVNLQSLAESAEGNVSDCLQNYLHEM